MKPWNLRNNALFLSCWYERSRPVQMVCFGIMIFGILFLTFLSISSQEMDALVTWKILFYVIAWIQSLVLLLQGTLFAGHLGSRERTSGTLDFHRNSPQTVATKISGLVFGSTFFEWAVFLILFVFELPFALLPDIHISQILMFNLSIMLTGIFFHTTAATISLLSTRKKKGSSLLTLFLLLWFGGPIFFYFSTMATSFFSHLLGFSAFQYIYPDQPLTITGRFYTVEFPLIIMQAIVQVPLFLLMINGMKRIFCMPNSPAWSKPDVIRFCGFLLFMVTGCFVAEYTYNREIFVEAINYSHHSYSGRTLAGEASLFAFLFVVLGIAASFFCVPTYFKCSKYIVLNKKGLIRNNAIFDDGATSLFAIISYLCIGGLFMTPYLITMACQVINSITSFLLLSSYIVAFAGFLEFFRLGRFRKNKIFFVTVMMIWWVFVPWLVSLLLIFRTYEQQLISASISPFFGLNYIMSLLSGEKPAELITLIIPCFVAGIMWLLAWQEHIAVKKQVSLSGGE